MPWLKSLDEEKMALHGTRNSRGAARLVLWISLTRRTVESWNDTNLFFKHQNAKCVYIFSMEYSLERVLKTHLLNNDLEEAYREALLDIGYNLD